MRKKLYFCTIIGVGVLGIHDQTDNNNIIIINT